MLNGRISKSSGGDKNVKNYFLQNAVIVRKDERRDSHKLSKRYSCWFFLDLRSVKRRFRFIRIAKCASGRVKKSKV